LYLLRFRGSNVASCSACGFLPPLGEGQDGGCHRLSRAATAPPHGERGMAARQEKSVHTVARKRGRRDHSGSAPRRSLFRRPRARRRRSDLDGCWLCFGQIGGRGARDDETEDALRQEWRLIISGTLGNGCRARIASRRRRSTSATSRRRGCHPFAPAPDWRGLFKVLDGGATASARGRTVPMAAGVHRRHHGRRHPLWPCRAPRRHAVRSRGSRVAQARGRAGVGLGCRRDPWRAAPPAGARVARSRRAIAVVPRMPSGWTRCWGPTTTRFIASTG